MPLNPINTTRVFLRNSEKTIKRPEHGTRHDAVAISDYVIGEPCVCGLTDKSHKINRNDYEIDRIEREGSRHCCC